MTPNITFVCGTPHGGALDSTAELHRAAIGRGMSSSLIVAADDLYSSSGLGERIAVRAHRWSPVLGRRCWTVVDWLEGRQVDLDEDRSVRVGNLSAAVARLHGTGGLIVVNSVRGLDLERLFPLARQRDAAVAWYLREESALRHVPEFGPKVDVLIANSRPLAEQASLAASRTCEFVPSVIDTSELAEPAERRVVLLVNSVEEYGLRETLAMAETMTDRQFVLQESWPLDVEAVAAIERSIAGLDNIEFRRRSRRSEIYRDARFMVAPHDGDVVRSSRPRVALEAQFLGVPILAHDLPGLASVIARADQLIQPGSTVSAWVEALDRLDSDYEAMSDAARRFAAQELMSPDAVWRTFARACGVDAEGSVPS